MISDCYETDVALPHHVEKRSARRSVEMMSKLHRMSAGSCAPDESATC